MNVNHYTQLFPSNEINLLYEGCSSTIELTQDQVAALIAMSFFGLNTWQRNSSFPRFNLTNLFRYTESVYIEKLKCIFHYFYTLAIEEQQNKINHNKIRTISIYRHIPSDDEYSMLRSDNLKSNQLQLSSFEFRMNGSIESGDNSLQIDFANKFIGGGVLGSGCVQEGTYLGCVFESLIHLLSFCRNSFFAEYRVSSFFVILPNDEKQ